VLLAAVLYSSVGHGGASGYLAAMALLGVAPDAMKPAALVLNVVVAGVGTARFARETLVPWRVLVPLVAGSVPAAAVGGALHVPATVYRVILGVVLCVAALRLLFRLPQHDAARIPRPAWLGLLGVGLGLVSGVTGVGGGIFLSPLMLLLGWEEPRRTAGASAAFILVNSVAGLAGHVAAGGSVPPLALPLAPVVLGGGLLGSWLGARRFDTTTLRRVLAVVLLLAAAKLVSAALA
jgi:hypothetical protein